MRDKLVEPKAYTRIKDKQVYIQNMIYGIENLRRDTFQHLNMQYNDYHKLRDWLNELEESLEALRLDMDLDKGLEEMDKEENG